MENAAQRILVVDDEPSIRLLMTFYLSRAGWEVVAVGSGTEALRVFQAGRFGAVLADVDLKDELDGIEVAARLLQQDARLKVMIMSGDPENARRVEESRLGVFIPKPLALDQPAIQSLLCCRP